jgi:DNA polymerase-1
MVLSSLPSPVLYLVDGHSQIFKAYHAIRELSGPGGIATNAVYGFHQILTRLIKSHKPSHLGVVLDSEGPTFRDGIYPEYKANRSAPPEDLPDQIRLIIEMLAAMRIQTLSVPGFEADDLLAALATKAVDAGWSVVLVSADKDLMQLVSPRVAMLKLEADRETVFDEEAVKEKMGVNPGQIGDYLALIGDSSDNIPGVKGIGPKTAASLLGKLGNLDRVLEEAVAGKIPGRQGELLRQGLDSARLSRRLVELDRHAPVPQDYEGFRLKPPDGLALAQLYRRVGFKRPLQELEQLMPELSIGAALGGKPAQVAGQGDLFDVQTEEGPAPVTVDTLERHYHCIQSLEDLERVVALIRGAGVVAIDTETTSTDALRADLVGISLSWAPGHAAYIPVGHRDELGILRADQVTLTEIQRVLGPILRDEEIRRLGHHAKFDWHMLRRHGLEPNGFALDTMLASYILLSDRRGHGLKDLARDLCKMPMRPITDLLGTGKNQRTFDYVDLIQATAYACADADATLRLAQPMEALLKESDPLLRKVFTEQEMPLVRVLVDMEGEGLAIDEKVFENLAEELTRIQEDLRQKIYEAAGVEFQLSSPKQLADVLFNRLGLKPVKKTKTGSSTDAEVLEQLASEHEVPRLMHEHRGYEKLMGTYVTVLPGLRHPETGRVHTTLNQHIAATGRLSSSDPNLQNIPIRTAWGKRIREGFVPRDPKWRLVAADYSQVELRVLAHISGDPALVTAYRDGLDVHRMTAATIFGVEEEDVTPEQRDMAKTVNFGIIYGMSANGLSQRLKISMAEAKSFIDGYFRLYSGVKAWLNTTLEDARRLGYVETVTGRRRSLPEIQSRNFQLRAGAERMAVNAPIQGTAADMIKLAMVNMARVLRNGTDGQGKPLPGGPLASRMILQVHDELIFDAPEEEVEALCALVKEVMEGAMVLRVPLLVEVGVGRTWAEC